MGKLDCMRSFVAVLTLVFFLTIKTNKNNDLMISSLCRPVVGSSNEQASHFCLYDWFFHIKN